MTMDKHTLSKYYPEGKTMEERLFELGAKLTRTSLSTWLTYLACSIFFITLGAMITAIAVEEGEEGLLVFGILFDSVAGVLIYVGIYGICRYNHGLHCLERAELLYNTRLAGKGETPVEAPTQPSTSAPKKTAPKPAKTAEESADKPSEEAPVSTDSVLFGSLTFSVQEKAVTSNDVWICPECCREMPTEKTVCKCGCPKPAEL